MSSPLRYPGGKRKLVPRLSELLAGSAGAFVECCVGGGALFWDLVPGFPTRAQVVLADASPAVRALYRRGVDVDLARELFADSEREGGYEALRDLLNADLQDQRCGLPANERRIAAAFWLLNRMCCNGVVRFNKRGEFNVPRGKRQSGAYLRPSEAQFCEAARATDLLRGLHPTVLADCALAVDLALRGAFVYADPPYSGGFVAYTREGWSTDDDIRLYEALGRAARAPRRVARPPARTTTWFTARTPRARARTRRARRPGRSSSTARDRGRAGGPRACATGGRLPASRARRP